ncbi:hypothetical protein [Oscillibacter sp.]|nr:hypothetical protein [Oscillibacter sp.]
MRTGILALLCRHLGRTAGNWAMERWTSIGGMLEAVEEVFPEAK